MTQDLNSGIENIEYNVLNLPKLITFANGGTIRYTYSATGEKLKAEYTMTSDSIIKTTIGKKLNEQFSSGPMSPTSQKFVWIEQVNLQ